jgi:hypothetical protein
MPYDDPEPDDPHVLVGVGLPADADATREMVAAFGEEFAQLGFDRPRILALFRNRFHAAAYAAYRALGEAEVARLVDDAVAVYAAQRWVVRDAVERPEAAQVLLEATRSGTSRC